MVYADQGCARNWCTGTVRNRCDSEACNTTRQYNDSESAQLKVTLALCRKPTAIPLAHELQRLLQTCTRLPACRPLALPCHTLTSVTDTACICTMLFLPTFRTASATRPRPSANVQTCLTPAHTLSRSSVPQLAMLRRTQSSSPLDADWLQPLPRHSAPVLFGEKF